MGITAVSLTLALLFVFVAILTPVMLRYTKNPRKSEAVANDKDKMDCPYCNETLSSEYSYCANCLREV